MDNSVLICQHFGESPCSNDKVPVYKLPQNNKDKKKWIAAILRANLVSKYMVVCRKHWPKNATFVLVYSKQRPNDLPFVFLIFQPAACSQHEKTFPGQQNKVCLVRASTLKMK